MEIEIPTNCPTCHSGYRGVSIPVSTTTTTTTTTTTATIDEATIFSYPLAQSIDGMDNNYYTIQTFIPSYEQRLERMKILTCNHEYGSRFMNQEGNGSWLSGWRFGEGGEVELRGVVGGDGEVVEEMGGFVACGDYRGEGGYVEVDSYGNRVLSGEEIEKIVGFYLRKIEMLKGMLERGEGCRMREVWGEISWCERELEYLRGCQRERWLALNRRDLLGRY